MSDKDPADYVIGPETTIEDVDLDEAEIYYKGDRLTEERAAELGEQAAHEAREDRQRNPTRDRKSASGGSMPSLSVHARVSGATHEKLEAIAEARGISMSKLTQEVLDDFVTRQIG